MGGETAHVNRPSQMPIQIARACIPYTPFKRELVDSRVALVTTAGVYAEGMEPFTDNDLSFRKIPGDVDSGHLRVVAGHYDPTAAAADINCVFPLDRLRDLVSNVCRGEDIRLPHFDGTDDTVAETQGRCQLDSGGRGRTAAPGCGASDRWLTALPSDGRHDSTGHRVHGYRFSSDYGLARRVRTSRPLPRAVPQAVYRGSVARPPAPGCTTAPNF